MGIETTGNRIPVLVSCSFIIDVHHIDFLHLAPFYTLVVEICDAVCRQIGYLDADLVVAFLERVLAVEDKRYTPCAADKLSVDIDAS